MANARIIHDASEGAGLLASDDSEDEVHNSITSANLAKKLHRNFLMMCVAFSLNHGCVVSCLAYSSTQLGDSLGGTGSGCLYIFYSVTAFLISKPIVSMVGPKYGLLMGVVGYCIYIAGFLFAILVPALAWPVFLVAASIGGIAGGLLWPSQGRYFAQNALLYAEETDTPVATVNSTFAGIFAACYLGFEMVTKVLATVVFLTAPSIAYFLIFSIYTCIAVVCCFFIAGLSDLDESGTWDFSPTTILINVASTSNLLMEDIRLTLMLPFQIAFGFTSSFVPFYIFGTVIADSSQLGGAWVGLLSAVIVLTGAVTAMPASWLANKLGKPVVMTFGGLCLTFSGVILYFASDKVLGTWTYIIIYLAVYGIGRGTWENTNKAVIADLFVDTPEHSTAGFSGISFANGFAGAIGYFTFSSMSRSTMSTVVTVFALVGIVAYWGSAYLHYSLIKEIEEREERLQKLSSI